MFYDNRIDFIYSWLDFVNKYKMPLKLTKNVTLLSINEIQNRKEYFYSSNVLDIMEELLNIDELWIDYE